MKQSTKAMLTAIGSTLITGACIFFGVYYKDIEAVNVTCIFFGFIGGIVAFGAMVSLLCLWDDGK